MVKPTLHEWVDKERQRNRAALYVRRYGGELWISVYQVVAGRKYKYTCIESILLLEHAIVGYRPALAYALRKVRRMLRDHIRKETGGRQCSP